MKVFALALFLAAAVMAAHSLALDAYKDEALYWQRLASLEAGDDEAFSDLRAAALTAKYPLQDYGITLMITGAAVFLAARNGRDSLKSPRFRIVLVLIAVALPLLTAAGAVFDILQAANRGDYPPWGDAVMIPLLGLPLVFFPLLLWSLFHLGVFWPFRKRQPSLLASALSRQANGWLLLLSVITAGLALYFAALGYWWMVLPGVGWLYYYLSLAADRRARLPAIARPDARTVEVQG